MFRHHERSQANGEGRYHDALSQSNRGRAPVGGQARGLRGPFRCAGPVDQAGERFDEVARRHTGTDAGAEALYWLGVAKYKQSHDSAQLRPSWQRLAQEYPNSEWTKRTQIPARS